MCDQYKTNYTEDEYGELYKDHIIDIYKLYVEMADRISQRRMSTNNFFVSVNTFLFVIISFFGERNNDILMILVVIGIIFSGAWYYLLKSYRCLNSGKFEVVQEIEKLLPLSPYKFEWEKLGNGKDKKLYWPLSHLEIILPILFGIIYFLVLVYKLAMM